MSMVDDRSWITVIHARNAWASHVLAVVGDTFVSFHTGGVGYESEGRRLLGEIQAGADPRGLKGPRKLKVAPIGSVTGLSVPADLSRVDISSTEGGTAQKLTFPTQDRRGVEVAREIVRETGLPFREARENVGPLMASIVPLCCAILPAAFCYQL